MQSAGCLLKCFAAVLISAIMFQVLCVAMTDDGFAPTRAPSHALISSEPDLVRDAGSTIYSGCRLCNDIGLKYQVLIGTMPPTFLGLVLSLSVPLLVVLVLLGAWSLLHVNQIWTLLTIKDAARMVVNELRER